MINNQKEESIFSKSRLDERYDRLISIGEGTYGKVFKGVDRRTGQTIALKKIKLESEEEGIPPTSLREISILKELDHLNIVKLLDVNYWPIERKLHLIFEFVEQDLRTHMEEKKPLSPLLIKSYLFQLLSGLNYCHQRRIFHRDLKPQNLLIDRNGILKIADFGLARTVGIPVQTLTHEVETLWYRAPEILLGTKRYSLPVDIWSVGCIFAEMIMNKPLFKGDSEIDQIFKIFQFHGTPTKETAPFLINLPDFKPTFPNFKAQNPKEILPKFEDTGLDLLLQMIKLEPAKRISVKMALSHPYFAGLDTTVFKTPKETSCLYDGGAYEPLIKSYLNKYSNFM